MTHTRQKLGVWGEALAADYLIQQGYCILERNARTPYGEIDIVAQQENMLVFVEVKTRRSREFGLPEQAVTPQKQKHIIASAQYYLAETQNKDIDWRIDVISIRQLSGKHPEIVHFENAVHG